MTEDALRVIVADDQTVVREGLVTLLGLMPGIEVAGAAADGAEACALVAEHDPDVALLDLRMPAVDGVEATRRIRERWPRTEVVVLTTFTDDASILGGARGRRARVPDEGRGPGADRARAAGRSGRAGDARSRRAGPAAGTGQRRNGAL